jgi:hypothetical protein
MERAQEFMKEYEKFKSGFMKKYLSDSKESSDHEPEYEYISGNEEDADCDSIPPEYLFQKDSSDSESDSEDKPSYTMMPSSKSFFSKRNEGAAMAIPVSEKEIQERMKKMKMDLKTLQHLQR